MLDWSGILLAVVTAPLMLHTYGDQSSETDSCGSQMKFWNATINNDLGEWTVEVYFIIFQIFIS